MKRSLHASLAPGGRVRGRPGSRLGMVPHRALVALGIFSFCAGSGCATRDQYLQLRDEVYQVRRVLADTRSGMDAQQREMQTLRGEVDAIRQGPGGARSHVPLGPDLPPLTEETPGFGPGGEPIAAPAPTPSPEPVSPSSAVSGEIAALGADLPGVDEYRTALGFIAQGNYGEAVPHLRSYLRKYPDTPLSDDAQYWIGESYYAQRDYNNAILAFYDVTRRYPKSDKVCAAMLKQGFAFAELGDTPDARIVLERLVQTHPACEEANQARVKLESLRQG